MINVGAYIDLPKWESAPITEQNLWGEGELNSQGPEGLDVSWWDEVPEGAQVYIEIRDLGFGEFFRGTDKVWKYTMVM